MINLSYLIFERNIFWMDYVKLLKELDQNHIVEAYEKATA